ncbi:MAG: diadenylate cyclase [Acholeplasmatales bacterium]|jgi:diadenylate cyclase|nr:diadenylate cyclase [Acholeplasmatales bacterium]
MIILSKLFDTNVEWWKILLDFYVIGLISSFVLRIAIKSKRILMAFFVIGFLFLLRYLAALLNLSGTLVILDYVLNWLPIVIFIILAADIKFALESVGRSKSKFLGTISASDNTKNSVIKAVFNLSSSNTGALITFEKYNNLEEYSEKAISINGEVTSELLENIFVPNTPLHDGAVIIRKDKIVCAGAYFVLSDNADEKTMGSRHRAGLGISEITDSVTIIVSEETGHIQLAVEGTLITVESRERLEVFLDSFIK